MSPQKLLPVLVGLFVATATASAQSPYQSSADFAKYAQKLRENALLKLEPKMEPRVEVGSARPLGLPDRLELPTSGRIADVGGKYPWKLGIVTTVFWVGEKAAGNNPTHNFSSSWDPRWMQSFGGFDNPDPSRRRGFIPAAFTPQQNPFYIALPYNDVTRGTTKPEASFVIPWFRKAFQRPGLSVCHGRWVAIRRGNRICYAQWEDCGPFRTDHWQYVFGKERPKANLNQGAGLDVSPAVRDFLEIKSTRDVCDWKFVDAGDVPMGPWAKYGENNDFVKNARRGTERMASGLPVR